MTSVDLGPKLHFDVQRANALAPMAVYAGDRELEIMHEEYEVESSKKKVIASEIGSPILMTNVDVKLVPDTDH